MDQLQIDNLTAQRMVHYLVIPFTQWEAYRIGIIDENGKMKREPQNSNETKYYNMFHILATRLRDLLKTSGRGTNWVLPANAGEFYLKNKKLPGTNITNWNIANRSSLPIFSAAYSAMRECLEVNDADIFDELMEFHLINITEDGMAIGNVGAQVVNPECGTTSPKYKQQNLIATKKKKAASEVISNIRNVSIK